jgi:protein-arginine kinase
MMNQVTKALEKLHVSISPYYSDSQDDTGQMFVLYSIPGPEGSIEEMMENFEEIVQHIVRREQQVRRKLLNNSGQYLQDAIGRAYGLLTNCFRLSMKEMRDALSLLRLGTLLGFLKWEEEETAVLNALNNLSVEQACLAAMAEETAVPDLVQRRARIVREFLNNHPHHFSDSDS